MRYSVPKVKGHKRTVSLTIDSEVYRQAKELKVNASKVAEEALANEVARRRSEAIATEIRLERSSTGGRLDLAAFGGLRVDLAL